MKQITIGTKLIRLINITEEGRGGGALYRILLVSQSLKNKVKSLIVFPKDSRKFKLMVQSAGLNGKELQLRHLSRQPSQVFRYLWTFIPEILSLVRLIKSENANIIHCNGSWQYKGVIASKISGCKCIWHMNDTYQPVLIRVAFKLLSGWVSGYIFASEKTKSYYARINERILSKPNAVIPAPVDTHLFTPVDKRPAIKDGPIQILTVGYINHNKGYETLIEAASILKTLTKIQFDFLIAGEVLDSQKDYYQKLVDQLEKSGLQNIHFLGHKRDVASLLRRCDIYTCTSFNESSPMAVWEALACGCYIIASKVGDIEEIFSKNECGILYNTGDASDLVEKIMIYAKRESPIKDIRLRARKTALETFSADIVSPKYLDFYNEILSDLKA